MHETATGKEAGEGAYRRDVSKRIDQGSTSTSPGTHSTLYVLENVWNDCEVVS